MRHASRFGRLNHSKPIQVMTTMCCATALALLPNPPHAAGTTVLPARAPAAKCGWKPVAAPTPGIGTASLNGIDALSPRDIWAVGSYNALGATLAEHWNGKKWSVVKTPNKSSYTALEDVAVISHKNAWAVGFWVPSGKEPKTLIEHWNGKKWLIVKSPSPLPHTNVLFGVDGAGPKGVFAVGTDNLGASAGSRQLTLRLTTKGWRTVANIGGNSAAEDVAAFSATSGLTVGHLDDGGTADPLVERFHAGRWSRVRTTSTANDGQLEDISVPRGTFGWAVGAQSAGAAVQTFAMRLGRTGWAEVPSADSAPTQINDLHGVATVSKGEAWAVGFHENPSFTRRTLIEHFSGGSWSIVSSPNATTHSNELTDVTAIRGQLWAVGFAAKTLGGKVVVEARRC